MLCTDISWDGCVVRDGAIVVEVNADWRGGKEQAIEQRSLDVICRERGLWMPGMKKDDLAAALLECTDVADVKPSAAQALPSYADLLTRQEEVQAMLTDSTCGDV